MWVPATWAGTVVANVEDGILTVTGTSGDEGITVRCEGGNVTVNQAEPGGGPAACSDLNRVLVFAAGGDDHVGLADVSRVAFGGLENVSADCQEGDDTLIGSGMGDSLQGGGGVDPLRGATAETSSNRARAPASSSAARARTPCRCSETATGS